MDEQPAEGSTSDDEDQNQEQNQEGWSGSDTEKEEKDSKKSTKREKRSKEESSSDSESENDTEQKSTSSSKIFFFYLSTFSRNKIQLYNCIAKLWWKKDECWAKISQFISLIFIRKMQREVGDSQKETHGISFQ